MTGKQQRAEHAKPLGVKDIYPVMRLPYHNRVDQTFTDGMHTIKDVVCNVMDVVLGKKPFVIAKLQLSKSSLAIADERCRTLIIPDWVDVSMQTYTISNPKHMKSHDWKQVCHIPYVCNMY